MLKMRFRLGVVLFLSAGLINCSTTRDSQAPAPASSDCLRFGDDQHFNTTRIKAFQELVLQQIQIAKSAPLSQKNSTLLPSLEVLRRRVNYPFLQPSLMPHTVTQVLSREAGNLISILETEAPGTPNTVNTIHFLNQNYLPSLENRDQWNCTSAGSTSNNSAEPGSPSGEGVDSNNTSSGETQSGNKDEGPTSP